MVAIDIEMPSCCVTYTSENDNYTACPFYKICGQREAIKTNFKPSDCPLVEIEERKVGKWKVIDDTHSQCMECGAIFCITSSNEWEVNYCPNCGADMRGSENERQETNNA